MIRGQALMELLIALTLLVPLVVGISSLLHAQERRLLCTAHALALRPLHAGCSPRTVPTQAPLSQWQEQLAP